MTMHRLKSSTTRDRKRGRPGRDTRITCTDVHGKTVSRQCTYELGVFVFQQWIDQAQRNELRFVQIVRVGDAAAYREWTRFDIAQTDDGTYGAMMIPGLGN